MSNFKPLSLSNDNPISNEINDALNFKDYADVIYETIGMVQCLAI